MELPQTCLACMVEINSRLAVLEAHAKSVTWFTKMLATALATAIVGVIVIHLAWH